MKMEQYSNNADKARNVAVLGLGYVGLPLALLFVQKGMYVTGIDSDGRKIDLLNNGHSYIDEVAHGDLQEALRSRSFVATKDYSAVEAAEAVIICVPTPLSDYGTPDLSYLTAAAREISGHLKKGQLIILESSTYPGTTREVLAPMLSRSKLRAGIDFQVAYSPERVDPGNRHYSLESIPKIVSGATDEALRRITELYGQVFDQVYPVSSTDAAEMVKLLENSFRLINISFMNEMAMACDKLKLDVWEVIKAADTKPFGFKAFYPGPGVGGHCIPVDPSYLLWKMNQYETTSDFIQIANAINDRMPLYIVGQLKKHLSPKVLPKARILIYGAAYKPDIADIRESASIELIRLLKAEGADVAYQDPYIPTLTIDGFKLESLAMTEANLKRIDCAVIATDHSSLPLPLLLEHIPLIYDTRNATNGMTGKAKIVKLGAGTDG